jgi:RNA-dependent RNA polymerase
MSDTAAPATAAGALDQHQCTSAPPAFPISQAQSPEKALAISTGSSIAAEQKNMVTVYRVFVTPTTLILCRPQFEQGNRVLRHYHAAADRFLRVTFSDEGQLPFPGHAAARTLFDRVRGCLTNGIELCGREYHFLAASSSQLRQFSCWFFAPTPEISVTSIRDWMGSFQSITCVAKYLARLGQSFSTSVVSGDCQRDEFEMTPDIEANGHVFSDGCGTISPRFARAVFLAYLGDDAVDAHGTEVPSAFQIRFRGFKGVVTLDPKLSSVFSPKLCLRPSMRKFECEHSHFEIISVSRRLPCFLNRQVITLLSGLGVPDGVFLALQHEMMQRMELALCDNLAALALVCREQALFKGPHIPMEMFEQVLSSSSSVSSNFSVQTEPFIRMVVKAFYARMLLDLRERSRIEVPLGACLIGVMDESFSLEYGQVFINLSAGDGPLLGPVVVAKNPCFHPGDVRVLHAIDVPSLRYLKDVVVFPGKGQRPHPNECSGSDLDGDIYFTTWDPKLQPLEPQHEPMDYSAPPTQHVSEVGPAHLVDFFVGFMENNSLGVIANTHLATADQAEKGIFSEECLELARLHSVAVDFPKSGVPATVPSACRLDEYPDFMEKKDKGSYVSKKVIGMLYRQVCVRPSDLIPALVECDPALKVRGFEKYVDEACVLRDNYNSELIAFMRQFGIQTEAEALSGNVLRLLRGYRKRQWTEVRQKAILAVSGLRKQYRQMFYDEELCVPALSLHKRESLAREKASAWYVVVYDNAHHSAAKSKRPGQKMLSFAWVMHDLLVQIKSSDRGSGISPE